MRGYSPTTPTGSFPYGPPGMGNMNSGFAMQQPQRYPGGGGGYNQMSPDAPNMGGMMQPNAPNMIPRYNMPPGTYNRGTRMEHVANSTLNNRSFGTVLVSFNISQMYSC